VNLRFTYKEFTLLLGIFVALIIALTVWAGPRNTSLNQENIHAGPKMIAPLVQGIVRKSVSLIEYVNTPTQLK
jgi:hypothetical protein